MHSAGLGLGALASTFSGPSSSWSLSDLPPGVLLAASLIRTSADAGNVADGASVDSVVDLGPDHDDPTAWDTPYRPHYRAGRFGGPPLLDASGTNAVLYGAQDRSGATELFFLGEDPGGDDYRFDRDLGALTLYGGGGSILNGARGNVWPAYVAVDAYSVNGVAGNVNARAPGLPGVMHVYNIRCDAGFTGGHLTWLADRFVLAGRSWPGGCGGFVLVEGLSSGDRAKLLTYLQTFQRRALVACCGDSLTQGGYGPAPIMRSQTWPALLSAAWHGCADVANLSQGGQGFGAFGSPATGTMLDDDPARLAAAPFDVTGRPAKIVVAWAGTNDLALYRTLAQLKADCAAYVAAQQAAGWQVVIPTMIDRQDVSIATNRNAFNSWLLAGSSGADAVVDLTGVSGLSDATDTTYYQSDKVHLTATGTALLLAPIQAALEALLP